MGREQGDHLDDTGPTVYVGTVNGVEYERPAYSPADHVNLKARGWVPKTTLGRENSSGSSTDTSTSADPQGPSDSSPSPENDATGSTGAKRGGRRAPEAASAAPQDDAAAAAGKAG